MPTQLELEALHRQESSEHNTKILETKVTRGLADLVNGKAIKSQIAEAVTELTVAKADLVNGKVPAGQLPSYVDDVLEVANLAALPATGETGKIYITIDTGLIYRWSGSVYVQIPTTPQTIDITKTTLFPSAESVDATISSNLYNNKIVLADLRLNQNKTYTLHIQEHQNAEMFFNFSLEGTTLSQIKISFALASGKYPSLIRDSQQISSPPLLGTFFMAKESSELGIVTVNPFITLNIRNSDFKVSFDNSIYEEEPWHNGLERRIAPTLMVRWVNGNLFVTTGSRNILRDYDNVII